MTCCDEAVPCTRLRLEKDGYRVMASDGKTIEAGSVQHDPNSDGVCADIISILDAVDLPIIVIDQDCRMVRFNRAAATVLRLSTSDIGNALGDVLAGIEHLDKLCAQVIADGVPVRRDIQDGERWFLLRIGPLNGNDRHVGGAVLTFTNVTAFRASIDQAIYEREYTKAILNTVIEPLVVLDTDLRVQTANHAFYEIFRMSRDETRGVPLYNLGKREWKTSGLWESLRATLSENIEFQTVEVERDFPEIGRRTLLIDARRLSREGDALLLLAFQDVTERKRAEEAVRQRTAQFETLLNQAPLGVYLVDADFVISEINPVALPVFGDIPGGILGRDVNEIMRILWEKEYAEEIVRSFRRTLETGESYVAPEWGAGSRNNRILRMAARPHPPA